MSDEPEDKIERQSFFAHFPKRSLGKVVMLLAMLAGIIVLQQRSGMVAGCVEKSFLPPSRTGSGDAAANRPHLPAKPEAPVERR